MTRREARRIARVQSRRALQLLLLLTLLTWDRAHATVYIDDDDGGVVGAYVNRWESLARSGESVVIRGDCVSACTLLIGVVSHVCVLPRARFGFHLAREFVHGRLTDSAWVTRYLERRYPARVRSYISHHGGLSTEILWMPASLVYPVCR